MLHLFLVPMTLALASVIVVGCGRKMVMRAARTAKKSPRKRVCKKQPFRLAKKKPLSKKLGKKLRAKQADKQRVGRDSNFFQMPRGTASKRLEAVSMKHAPEAFLAQDQRPEVADAFDESYDDTLFGIENERGFVQGRTSPQQNRIGRTDDPKYITLDNMDDDYYSASDQRLKQNRMGKTPDPNRVTHPSIDDDVFNKASTQRKGARSAVANTH